MLLREAREAFVAARRRAGRARGTVSLYNRQLVGWDKWRMSRLELSDMASITDDEVNDYLAYLRENHVPHGGRVRHRTGRLQSNTLSSVYRTIRTFWRYCERQKQWVTPEQIGMMNRVDAPRIKRSPRTPTDREAIRTLLDMCDVDVNSSARDQETAARNRALIYLLDETGARISELCSLTDERVNLHKRRATVIAKGGDTRAIFWRAGSASALAQYLLLRRGLRGGDLPLFRGTSSRNPGGALSADAARSMMKRLAKDAGVKLPFGAPLHGFRHGYARRAINQGADISDVKQLLGHRDLETTMLYLENDDDLLAETYDRIFGQTSEEDGGHRDKESHDRKLSIFRRRKKEVNE